MADLSLANAEFVVLAEKGVLAQQALGLVRSIRRYAGMHAAITVVSPRARTRPSDWLVTQYNFSGARFRDWDLSNPCPEYGPSFKVLALAKVEKMPGPPVLVQIDSDSVFLRPAVLEMGDAEMLARVADAKGMASSGSDDPSDIWWQEFCGLCGVGIDQLGTSALPDGTTIRTEYNGGLIVARRSAGLFTRTAGFFNRLVAKGMKPWPLPRYGLKAGHGDLDSEASRWWGTTEAALAVAAVGMKVRSLPPGWNVPMYSPSDDIAGAVHVHYHHLRPPGAARSANAESLNPSATVERSVEE